MNYQDAALKNHAFSCYLNCHNCESHPCRAPFSGCCSPWAAHSLRACPRLRKVTPYERCGWMEDCTPVWMMVSAVLQTDDVWLPPPTEVGGYPDTALQSRLVADGRGFAPIPWVGTHSEGWHPRLCYVTTTWFYLVCCVTVGYAALHPRLGYFTAMRFYVVALQ